MQAQPCARRAAHARRPVVGMLVCVAGALPRRLSWWSDGHADARTYRCAVVLVHLTVTSP